MLLLGLKRERRFSEANSLLNSEPEKRIRRHVDYADTQMYVHTSRMFDFVRCELDNDCNSVSATGVEKIKNKIKIKI